MKRHVTRLILLLCVAGWLTDKTAAIGQERTISGEEKVDTLVMLASQIEANYRKIGTWSGVYDLRERLYSPNRRLADGTDTGPGWQVSEVVVGYTIDAKTDRVRVDFVKEEPSKRVDRKTGEDIPVNYRPQEYRTIRTPEHFLHFATRSLRGRVIGFPMIAGFDRVRTRVVYRRNKRRARADQFHMNPLTFFGPGYSRFSVTCSALAKWLLDENSETRRKNTTTLVQRQVDGVTEYSLTIRHPSDDGAGNNHVETIVFSSAADFNPLTYDTISFGRREVEMNWEYRKHGEIMATLARRTSAPCLRSTLPEHSKHARLASRWLEQRAQQEPRNAPRQAMPPRTSSKNIASLVGSLMNRFSLQPQKRGGTCFALFVRHENLGRAIEEFLMHER